MLDNSAWDKIADRVNETDFYRADHQLIFAAIARLADEHEPFDAVTLSEHLERRNQLQKCGGLAYLGTLANETPSAANIQAYADIVRERSLLRSLIDAAGEIASSAFSPDGRSASALVDAAERRVFEIAERGKRHGSGFQSLRQILPSTVDRLDVLSHSDGDITGISSGFTQFDDLTAGLQRSDLIVSLGARFDDRVTGNLDSFAPNAKVVHADIDPAEIGKNRHADVPIVGDVREVLRELLVLL
ncbi:MAG: DnaB-like helicase N-terminal domain-containing protein, partial [Gammaproteobacteria bacterium]